MTAEGQARQQAGQRAPPSRRRCRLHTLLRRHRALPLTCRRLSRLVNSPQLLRAVEFDSTDDILSAKRKQPSLAAAQSFDCWAVRHAAGAVQRLSLRIGSPTAQGSAEPDAIWSEMLGVLAACGAAGGLQEARLYVQFCSASLPAWLPVALRGVRLLHIVVEEGMLQVDVSLTAMTVLTDLHLEATAGDAGLHFETAALLPRALRRLHLAGTCWVSEPPEELPPQVGDMCTSRHVHLQCAQPEFAAAVALLPCHSSFAPKASPLLPNRSPGCGP